MQPYTILIIDDEASNIEAVTKILSEANFRVIIATSGKAGYNIALKTIPNLIITDWEMPGLSGIETSQLIKSNSKLSEIPIIMATGKMLSPGNLKTALEAGAIDYIRKPINKTELLARVNSAINLFESIKKNREQERVIYQQKKILLKEKEKNLKRQLVAKTLILVKNSKTNTSLLNSISQLYKHSDETGQKLISDLISEYKLNVSNSNWEEFELLFNEVHPNFYQNIIKVVKKLTVNERKLCAFLRLNMTSKEISAITQQSTETIKKARFRLRKKLEILPEQNLNIFLQKI